MKKRIIICVTCIAVAGIYADAQNKSTIVSPPSTTSESFIAAIPPPPPPPPPAPAIPPSIDGVELPVPPVPPVPPMPPVPPAPPIKDIAYASTENPGPEIFNSNGNEMSVRSINGASMVIVKKDGKTQKIKLSTWNANRKYYEKKFGQLPPPPPPVPAVEEKDSQ